VPYGYPHALALYASHDDPMSYDSCRRGFQMLVLFRQSKCRGS
jgi:hypothetical protein